LGGKSFCAAAKDAFFMILKNALRVAAVQGLSGIFVTFGKFFVMCACTVGGYFIVT